MLHCAYKHDGTDIQFELSRSMAGDDIVFHHFGTLDELMILSQRFHIDFIIISGESDFLRELDMVRLIKNNIFLSIIPTVLYHPEPAEGLIVAGYQNGVEEFLHGDWRDTLFQVRIRMVAARSRRDISFNPSTALPGPSMIEKEIERLLQLDVEFAVCYADLDDFKPYNDYYGYFYGDRLIRITARIIRDIVFDTCREGFVGHIGGDDFMYIIPADKVRLVCGTILKVFDTIVPFRYSEEDRLKGMIIAKSRKGDIEEFPIMSLSIAVLISHRGEFTHVGEMSHMLADLKKYVKSLDGSNYVVERRKKY